MSTDPTLARIHQALARDHVYVDPSLASRITPAQLQAIRTNIAATDQPVYVVLYPYVDTDAFAGRPADLLTRLHDAYPSPGVYLSTTTQLAADDYSGIQVDGHQWGLPGQPDGDLTAYELPLIFDYEHQTSLGATFDRATSLLAAGPDAVSQAFDRAQAHPAAGTTSTSSGTGSGSDGSAVSATTLVVALVVVAALVTVVLGLVKRLRARRSRPAFALPRSAMEHIRVAHDRRLEQQARDELLALGERIDGSDLTAAQDTASWQAALDHYDAARAVVDRESPPDLLDVVGCLVLARRGQVALDAAVRGRTWTPPHYCYLDPLHGVARVTRVVDPGDGDSRQVPLCAACRADVDARRAPDILDVERHGKPVHYFDAAAEPWSSTGYGCFGDDLVVALQQS